MLGRLPYSVLGRMNVYEKEAPPIKNCGITITIEELMRSTTERLSKGS
jgi:hypothetical protein